MSVSLYGEVQKEVIEATLAADFGLDVGFRETTTICIERLVGTGAAVERMHEGANPFRATIGLRIGRRAGLGREVRASGRSCGLDAASFFRAVEDTVLQTLRQGLCGWQVTDCVVTLTHSGYVTPATRAGPSAVQLRRGLPGADPAGPDGRAAAGRNRGVRAGPAFRLDVPAATLGLLLPALARLRAVRARTRAGPVLRARGRHPGGRDCTSCASRFRR